MRPPIPLLVLLAGCAFEPPDAVKIDPPPLYREIYAEAERCTGRRGNFDQLTFYVSPVPSWDCRQSHGQCAGLTRGHSIWLAEKYKNDHGVLLHEMIHTLLGTSDHPYHPFTEPCHAMW